MINEDDKRPVKKPIPLPRKSLMKLNKNLAVKEAENKCDNETLQDKVDSRNFVTDDWRSATESFTLGKSKLMKNEVYKFEKSIRSIISKRRSTLLTSEKKSSISDISRNDSLQDGSIFYNISFNSPLSEDCKLNNSQSTSYDESCCDTELLPPPYPPPDLPDESLYDQMRNFNLSNPKLDENPSTHLNDLSYNNEPTESTFIDLEKQDFSEATSSIAFEAESNNDEYEIIASSVQDFSRGCYNGSIGEPNALKVTESEKQMRNDMSNEKKEDKIPHIKYIIHLFDPLQEQKVNIEDFGVELKNALSNFEHLPDYSSHLDLVKNKPICNSFSLSSNSDLLQTVNSDMKIISLNLEEGNYGKIKRIAKPTHANANSSKLLLEPPPIPPRAVANASMQSSEKTKDKLIKEEPINHDSESEAVVEEKFKPTDIKQWSSLKRVAKKVVDNIENRTNYLSLAGKKSDRQYSDEFSSLLNKSNKSKPYHSKSDIYTFPQNYPKHSGVIFRPGGIQRWGVLSQRKLTLFANKDSPDVKETVPMDNVLSVQATQNKISGETVGVHCFEISISSRSQMLLFGVPSVSERHIWMRKLLESIGPGFPPKLSMDYRKAGWCFAKESITCPWAKYCILLHHRSLYLSSECGIHVIADLRKARNIILQSEGFTCEKVTENGPLLLVDLQDKTLYLQMDYERETRTWELAIKAAALKNGPTLCEQQLTKDNVPAIVDKCLNFIHTHGSFSEGIYRRNGSNRTVNQLLAAFRCNAWCVQLSKDEYTEFDVSSVLKRFFRDLPEPLLVPEILNEMGNVLDIADIKERIQRYKIVLKTLPEINYLTARRLLCHLYFLDKQRDKNLMGAENLAAIWGPTILQVQEKVSLDSSCFKMETFIVNDLISYYPEIFDVEKEEVEREMKILQLLESYFINSNSLNKKPSGELKIWVYLDSPKNVDNCINITINPQKTAHEVCKELSCKTNEPIYSLCLEEVVCNGLMSRPLNHSEKVLDTVLRWSYWDEADRKDNCLVLTTNSLFQQVVQYSKRSLIFSEELKFADQKSKTFKTYLFEFSQAKLICHKDKLKVGEWKIEDIVWYLGHDPKRVPNAKWSITFIEKRLIESRSKEKPYFGNTICGSCEEQKLKLVTAMLMAQYTKDILLTPNLLE